MSNIILIAGTHHGGWYWDSLAESLRQLGHETFAPTLAGLDDENPYAGLVNLDTHINHVLELIRNLELSQVVLVGSSYGVMVITGVAARQPSAIKHVVYLDAALPRSGQSEWDINSKWLQDRYMNSVSDGLNIDVPQEWLVSRPRLMPHPLGTKLQPLVFDQANLDGLNKTYVHAEKGFGPGLEHFFAEGYHRALSEPGWQVFSLPAGHDVASELPDEVLEIIVSVS